MEFRIFDFDSLDSTNTYLKQNIEKHLPGDVICARVQTGGRGRRGKTFLSPAETGLYLSVLLQPADLTEGLYYPFAAGLAAAEAIAALTASNPELKWPNDVLIRKKKIAGILAEVGSQNTVILGIGINLTTPSSYFAENELWHVSSVLAETGSELSPQQMRTALLANLSKALSRSKEEMLMNYRKRCITIGREIRASNGIAGICTGVASGGELIVQDQNGAEHLLNSGEVSISGLY